MVFPLFHRGKQCIYMHIYICIYQTYKLWTTQVTVFGMQTQKKPVDHCVMNLQSSSSFSSCTTLVWLLISSLWLWVDQSPVAAGVRLHLTKEEAANKRRCPRKGYFIFFLFSAQIYMPKALKIFENTYSLLVIFYLKSRQ